MRRIKSLNITLFAFSVFLLWSCASHPKIASSPQTPLPSTPPQKQITQPLEQEKKVQEFEEETEQKNSETLDQESNSEQRKDSPEAILEEAMYAYQDAQVAWEKGDFETALSALDETYRLLLKLKLPPDSPLIQDKNDLRLLIAQKIQAIYASHLTTVIHNHNTIPLIENDFVLQEIENFRTKERKLFETAYGRSGRYRPMILEQLRQAGLPEELSWIPMIESWFNVRAYSRARALGLWQFIASTGTRFGLKRDRWIDERMDPIKSTQSALKYLNELHSFFGDWTTALAAYNCGEFKVQKVISSQRIDYLDNFWDLYPMLPRETARFVPRFIATLLIVKDPDKYGFALPETDPLLEYEEVTVNSPVKLSSLSKALGLEEGELEVLNPELRHKSTPDQEYLLKVPRDYGERVLIALASLPQYIPPQATYTYYYVRSGETLSIIAQRYGTSVSEIAQLSGLRSIHVIRPGQRLKIPVRSAIRHSPSPPLQLIKEGQDLIYVVKRGDSIYKIAGAFNTTVDKIKEDNSLQSDNLAVGQKLVIHSGIPEGATTYMVRSGDSPFEIARRFGMDLDDLLNLNGLSLRSKIYPGQELWVVLNGNINR